MGRFYRASVCGVDVIITVIASVVQTLAKSDYSKRMKTFGDVYSSNTWSRKNCFLWHFYYANYCCVGVHFSKGKSSLVVIYRIDANSAEHWGKKREKKVRIPHKNNLFHVFALDSSVLGHPEVLSTLRGSISNVPLSVTRRKRLNGLFKPTKINGNDRKSSLEKEEFVPEKPLSEKVKEDYPLLPLPLPLLSTR